MKYILIFLTLLLSQGADAKVHDHSIGVHGMVLMMVEDKIIASHLPFPHGKHAVQLLVELEPEASQLGNIKQMLRDNKLVTLMPETFSLTELRSGRITRFKGTVFAGHFERQYDATIKNVAFKVGKQLLNQAVASHNNGAFYVLGLENKLSLLVHRIGKTPSFDQILLVEGQLAAPAKTAITLGDDAPLKDLPEGQFKLVKPLYLETKDFL